MNLLFFHLIYIKATLKTKYDRNILDTTNKQKNPISIFFPSYKPAPCPTLYKRI